MDTHLRPCHILVAGGGVAGLTLALALEKHNIPYTLLESYPNLIPKVGAGICLLPNGLRILDQLGCYEDLRGRVGANNVLEAVYVRDHHGTELHISDGWKERMEARWGYNGLWCDRSMLLETLYDHIIDKSKLLTGKKVERIRHLEDIVEITTTDGSKYTGDIVVGTDGVHSRVRQEMVQYAKELGVAEDYTDDDLISATYACLFGLSTSTPTLPRGLLGWNLGHDYSYITGTGPEDRTYWGLMIKLDRTYYGKEIPVLTEEDKERIIRKHWDDPITAEIHLSDLYKRSIHILASPLREIVLKKWFCGRMVVLGDAAHKMLPIIAQGGNQAFETVAAFTNELVSALCRPCIGVASSKTPLSLSELRSLFSTLQTQRMPRLSAMVEMAQNRQRMDVMATRELEEFVLNKFPAMMPGALVGRWDQGFPGAVSFRRLQMPERKKELPFDDERPTAQ
ncbi:hypothetical protein ASPCAL12361 [Aspergillus calidoustus]|uniref:FAD-binding domain-containing protein n=1 Tax=Aspergillus calidoustus TaxID=454130 RepID=A0A0U5GBL5_ASPCI|nr:hypothetical protein ASPCAL12361 [Aspergillus calidoustus]